jgi:23S rRNA (adenine2030-N6)-methyltransferase
MFSYRHAFHAGNHADVLKHTVLVALLRYLTQKDTALSYIDTHAGAGLYRLDGDYAGTSGEASQGIALLAGAAAQTELAPALQDYLDVVAGFNSAGSWRVYPGSPFIAQRLLRPHDRLKLYELHPSDARALQANVAQLRAGRQVTVLHEDGFGAATKFLPPPSRRGLLLCDPSYEIKSDYARVATLVSEALQRFATGTFLVWHPIIPRPEAHELPRRLRTLATKAGRPWLHATLTVKSGRQPAPLLGGKRPGLPASGVFMINPPHTLVDTLQPTLPQLARLLSQDRHAAYTLERGG